MGGLAPKATLLLCAAASVCQAHWQLAKEPLPFAQTRLNPLVVGEAGSAQMSPVSPVSPFGYGTDSTDGADGTAKNNASAAFFVYHSHDFAGGRGISIITTPERAQRLAQATPPADANDFSSPPYTERHMPGKGRGLVATRMLRRGDRIFADTPILLLDADAYEAADARWAALPSLAVDALPPSSQQLFWDLHHQPGRDAVRGRIDPNVFELDLDDDGFYYGLFPEIARLNHDCRPNAVYYFDAHTLTHHIHAVTDIAPGTEISITYIGPLQSRDERAARLRQSWDFNCSCSACTQTPELTRLSDRRIAHMDDLVDRLDDDDGWASAPPHMAETLVSLFLQERLYADVYDGYLLAALAHCASGNYWDTVKYAHLAVEAGALYEGTSHPDVAMLSGLAAKPDGAKCWMRRTKWASA